MVDVDGFDERDQRWYCACNTHCEKGVFAIGVFSIVLAVFNFAGSVSTVLGFSDIISLALGVMLIVASKRRDATLLLPSIVVLYVQITFAVVGLMCCLAASIALFIESHGYAGAAVSIAFFILCIDLALGIWFLSVVKQYRSFLEAYSRAHDDANHLGSMSAPQTFVTSTTVVAAPPATNVVHPSQPVVNPNFESYMPLSQKHLSQVQ